MRVIAIENFHPPGLARPIRPGEVLEVEESQARGWLGLGFVRLAAAGDEDATRRPAEQATAAPPEEKLILRPRENAARRRKHV